MGHFLPQRHQRRFECPDRPGFIWQHDRRTGEARQVAIKKAGQSRNYYEQSVEQQLAVQVEAPTNPIIDKLIEGVPISPLERRQLSLYVATMLMRVPRTRREQREAYPTIVTEYYNDVRRQLAELPSVLPDATPEFIAMVSARVDILERTHRDSPPPEMLAEVYSPFPYRNMVEAIEAMTWRVLIAPGPQYFITNDTPAFYFGDWGLSRQGSELSFPLSTTHALHGCWQPAASSLVYVRPTEGTVREINRRLASTTERCAFYHAESPWLLRLLAKDKPYLSAIYWSNPPRWREPPPGALVADGTRYPLGHGSPEEADTTEAGS
jgi:uncharacterized protein DUF4238